MFFLPLGLTLFSLASSLLADPLIPLDETSVNGNSSNAPDFTLGSPDYPKGQVASALINNLLQLSIDSGIIGGEIFPCPDQGLYGDPFDCTYFFNCTGEDEFGARNKCPEKQAFDNNTQSCAPYDSVSKCKELLRDEGYKCQFNGLHLYPKDCNKYYICIGSRAYIYHCPEGENFDNALRFCLPKDQALCIPENSVPVVKGLVEKP